MRVGGAKIARLARKCASEKKSIRNIGKMKAVIFLAIVAVVAAAPYMHTLEVRPHRMNSVCTWSTRAKVTKYRPKENYTDETI